MPLSKQQFAELVASMPGASDDEILEAARKRESESQGLVSKVWEKANEPLTTLGSKAGKAAGDAIDQRTLGESPTAAKLKGFAAGALEGAGGVVDSLTSPLNIAMSALGFGAAKAGAKGLLGISRAARAGEAALNAPLVAEGAHNVYEGAKEGDFGKAGAGMAEAAGGLAGVRGAFKHSFPVQKVAETYAKEAGIPVERVQPHTPVKVDPERAKGIADAYEAMPHEPGKPEVANSYQKLGEETSKQFKFMTDRAGVKAEPWKGEGQPYANSAEMMDDIRKNNHLWFFPTEAGYGEGGATAAHPMLAKGESGMPVNDEFRAIHDYFGHAKEGHQFGPNGEENAWVAHSKMFSDDARPAMTSETRGQNSWVNSGPHLRNADGNVPKRGEAGYVPPAERPFAEQKAGLLPAEYHQLPSDVLPRVAPEAQAAAGAPGSPATARPPVGASVGEISPTQTASGGGERIPQVSPSAPVYDLPRASSIVAELTSKNDGASFNLFKGDLAGTPHYAVSVFPERGEVIQGQATPEHIAAFVEKNQDLLQDPKNSIGTWFNKADGKTYLDISVTTPDIKEAATLGKANNQLAIFDLGNFQEISLQPHPSAEFTPVGEEAAYARPQFKDPMEGIRDKIAQSGGRDLARVAREQKARGIETGQQPPGQVPVQMQDPNGPLNVYKPGYEEAVKQRQAMRAGELSKDVIDLNGPQDKPKRLPSGLATAGLVAGPGVAAAIPDDPDSNLDDYGRVGINILAGAGILAASVRGRQVKNLSPIQDAAAKGAAALWMGGKKAWAQAVGEHRSPKLLAASQKLLDRHIQSTVNELPTTKKLLAMAKQGVTDHDWYDKTEVELQKMFGKDAQLMANLFAATSNNATVMSNASLALKAYRQIKTGEPITGFLPDVIENIKRAAAGQPLNGRKIDNFAKAMSGDPDAVVVDRWIMRAFGFNKGSAPTETQYDFMENAIRNLAQKAGQTPRQFQAALWFAYKNAAEAGKKRPPSPAPEGAIKRSIDIRHGEALRENRKFDKEKAKGPQLPFASGQ